MNIFIAISPHWSIEKITKYIDLGVSASGFSFQNVHGLGYSKKVNDLVEQWCIENNKNYLNTYASLINSSDDKKKRFDIICNVCQKGIIMWDGATDDIKILKASSTRSPLELYEKLIT